MSSSSEMVEDAEEKGALPGFETVSMRLSSSFAPRQTATIASSHSREAVVRTAIDLNSRASCRMIESVWLN